MKKIYSKPGFRGPVPVKLMRQRCKNQYGDCSYSYRILNKSVGYIKTIDSGKRCLTITAGTKYGKKYTFDTLCLAENHLMLILRHDIGWRETI